MSISLQLESATDVVSLNDLVDLPTGVQALAGATGFGLPPVAVQWLEGAGNGARYRGRRAQTRTFDLPIYIDGGARPELQALWRRLVLMLMNEAECRLRLIQDDGSSWWIDVIRTGGGELVYGQDTTGENDLRTVLSLTAGYPLWTAESARSRRVQLPRQKRGLLPHLSKLPVMPSAAFDKITVDNRGDAPAPPVWKIVGPGTRFEATSPAGESLVWAGTLLAEESITFDIAENTVTDHLGNNRYDELEPAPKFWSLPPGESTFTCRLSDASPGAAVPGQELRRNFARNPSARGELDSIGGIPGFGLHMRSVGENGVTMSTDAPATVALRTNICPDPRGVNATWTADDTVLTGSTVASGGPLGFGYSSFLVEEAAGEISFSPTPTVSTRAAVTAGEEYTLSVYARTLNNPGTTRLGLTVTWYSPTGYWVGGTYTVFSGSRAVTGDWYRFSTLPLKPPTGATSMSFSADFNQGAGDVAAGVELNITGFLLERTSSLKPYFDGATAAVDHPGDVRYTHAWVGGANASASTQSVAISPQAKGPGGVVGSFARRVITELPEAGKSAGWSASYPQYEAPIQVKQGEFTTISAWLRYVAPAGGPDSITVEFQANVYGVPAEGGGSWWGHRETEWTLRSGEWVRLTGQVEATYEDVISSAWRARYIDGPPVGSVIDCTGLLVEQGLNVGAFFDGDTATSDTRIRTWTDTPHASASIESESVWSGASEIQCTWRDRSWAVI